jgi:hypothetical protein
LELDDHNLKEADMRRYAATAQKLRLDILR